MPSPVCISRALHQARPPGPSLLSSTHPSVARRASAPTLRYFYYPFNFVLPTGDMFVWSNKYGQIINPLTGKKVLVLPNWKGIPQAKGMCTQYPFSGTAAMLPLRATNNFTEVEIM